MIPRQALFAPTPVGPQLPPPPNFLPTPEDTLPDTPEADTPHASRRQNGWSAPNQRRFLEAIAEGHGVEAACRHVGLSVTSAYAFRRTAKGAAFALGWRAAALVAREAIAETLLVRALEGQVDTYTRADGTQVTRHRHDNRLAMSLLARLDRQVEAAPDADAKAARLVAQEFDAYLDLVTRDEGPARAGLFLARRSGQLIDADDDAAGLAPIYALATADRLLRTGVATAAEVPVADLDPHARAGWTAEQWQRAEAAGLLRLALPEPENVPHIAPEPQHSQHSASEDGSDEASGEPTASVWWDEDHHQWLTNFPPPDDFEGWAEGRPDHVDYIRTLDDAEEDAMGPGPDHYDAATLDTRAADRDAYFAARAALRPTSAVEAEEDDDAEDEVMLAPWIAARDPPPAHPSRMVSITT